MSDGGNILHLRSIKTAFLLYMKRTKNTQNRYDFSYVVQILIDFFLIFVCRQNSQYFGEFR